MTRLSPVLVLAGALSWSCVASFDPYGSVQEPDVDIPDAQAPSEGCDEVRCPPGLSCLDGQCVASSDPRGPTHSPPILHDGPYLPIRTDPPPEEPPEEPPVEDEPGEETEAPTGE